MINETPSTLEERLSLHFASVGETIARSQSRILATTSLIRVYLSSVEITSLQVERSKRRLTQARSE